VSVDGRVMELLNFTYYNWKIPVRIFLQTISQII